MAEFIKTGVIGHPIAHSKSPLIHNYWIEKYNLNGRYEALDILPADLAQALERLMDEGYAGFNLTIPHKEIIVPLCDEIDACAQGVGAVNTIAFKKGKILGKNTDVFGFLQNIKDSAPDFDFAKGPALIIGAGGAARAVICGLLQEGAPEIRIVNRTQEKAEVLQYLSPVIRIFEWEERSENLHDLNLLVNTTSLGMKGQPALELDLSGLNEEALVNDIVYAPLQTELLKNAKARGNQTVTGIGMLLQQARPAFERWYGVLPEIDETLLQKVLA